jgi:hypothetical protein
VFVDTSLYTVWCCPPLSNSELALNITIRKLKYHERRSTRLRFCGVSHFGNHLPHQASLREGNCCLARARDNYTCLLRLLSTKLPSDIKYFLPASPVHNIDKLRAGQVLDETGYTLVPVRHKEEHTRCVQHFSLTSSASGRLRPGSSRSTRLGKLCAGDVEIVTLCHVGGAVVFNCSSYASSGVQEVDYQYLHLAHLNKNLAR